MTNRHVKRFSMSLFIREVQVKTTMKYHITPVRMAIINKTTKNKCWRRCREREILVGGMQIGTATVEGSMELPQKIKNGALAGEAQWLSDSP